MRREFITVAAAESLLEARRTMRLARLRHLLVVDDAGQLVGIVSYRDLQEDALSRAEARPLERWREELREIAVREAMVPSPYFVSPETPANEAALRMARLRLGCLPVCESSGDGTRLVGIVAESDLLLAAWR
jgi:acetoin utilization protein AcuB